VLPDGRKANEIASLDVVIADDGEVVRNVEAKVLCGSKNAQGLGIAGGEDRARTVVIGKHLGSEIAGLVPPVCAEGDVLLARRTPGHRQSPLVTLKAVSARGEAEGIGEGVADEANVAMPEV
jgi:hypothetical protein